MFTCKINGQNFELFPPHTGSIIKQEFLKIAQTYRGCSTGVINISKCCWKRGESAVTYIADVYEQLCS